jgi:hypothetical protein
MGAWAGGSNKLLGLALMCFVVRMLRRNSHTANNKAIRKHLSAISGITFNETIRVAAVLLRSCVFHLPFFKVKALVFFVLPSSLATFSLCLSAICLVIVFVFR